MEKRYHNFKEQRKHPLKILLLLTSSGLTSRLDAVMYSCTPGPRHITAVQSAIELLFKDLLKVYKGLFLNGDI